MEAKIETRLERWNIAIITTVIIYTVVIQRLLLANPIINPLIDSIAIFLTSLGVYRILINILHFLTKTNPFLLRFYWGNQYLNGLWSYTYYRDNQELRGIWRIDQDLYSTKILGFGIDEKMRRRSRVRSVTDLTVES